MMEKLENENKTRLFTVGKSGQKLTADNITVHIMPKRYLNSSSDTQQAKKIGIFVLAFGAVILVAGLFFLYFYVFAPSKKEIKTLTPPSIPKKSTVPAHTTNNNSVEKSKKETTKIPTSSPKKNTNVILNNNTNTASSANIIVATSTEKNASNTAIKKIKASSSPILKLVPVQDSDGDGLSDVEEALLGSNPKNKDSDGDGYSDLSEFLNLYNPTGKGSIMVNSNIGKYTNSSYNYVLYYPEFWKINEVGGKDSIIFNIGNNQFIQIIAQINKNHLSLNDWYKKELNVNFIPSSRIFYKKGWQGLTSADGLTVYLSKKGGNEIIVMTYNLGNNNILNYKNIFSMMINSLESL